MKYSDYIRLSSTIFNTIEEAKDELDNLYQLSSFSKDLVPSLQKQILEDLVDLGYSLARQGRIYILDESFSIHINGAYSSLMDKIFKEIVN